MTEMLQETSRENKGHESRINEMNGPDVTNSEAQTSESVSKPSEASFTNPGRLMDEPEETASGDSEENPEVNYKRSHNRAFSEYDNDFQERIFHLLVHDRNWAQEIAEVMSPEMFDAEHLRYLSGLLWKFFRRYKAFPSKEIFKTTLKENIEGADDALRAQIIEFLPRIKSAPDPSDAAYIKDKVASFCRHQNFKDALLRSVDLMESERYDAIYSIMRSAVSSSTPGNKGHDFHKEREARWSGIDRNPVPTGMEALDSEIQDGLSSGELAVVVAATGVGKSHWITNVGAQAVMRGKNVVHYTFELSEHETGRRYDAWFTGVDSNEILLRNDEVKAAYDKMEKDPNINMGGLIIKEYPTGTASVVTLKAHLEKLRISGFAPDMILVDYADIMKAAAGTEGERFKQKAVYEELRALAKEMNVPIWTASQSNREGASSDIITSENMSEAYGKAMVADLIVSLSRKPMEKAYGTARMYLAKSRLGRDGILFNVEIDTAHSRFDGEKVSRTLMDVQQEDAKLKREASDDILKQASKKWSRVRGELNSLERIDRGE